MKNKDIEKSLKRAVDVVAENVFTDVISFCDESKEDNIILMTPEKKNKRNWIKYAAAVIAVALIGFAAGIIYSNYFNYSSVVAIEVNPQIELKVDSEGKVIRAVAKNKEAEQVLEGMELKNVSLDDAAYRIISSLAANGYLNDMNNSVLLSVKNVRGGGVSTQTLISGADLAFTDTSLDGAVIMLSIDDDDDRVDQLARDFNISEAKAELILQITDTDPTQNAESLSALSVNELCAIYQSRNITNTNTVLSGSVSVKAYIGSDEALNIALNDAGTVIGVVSELDVEFDSERGVMVYEVEFNAGGREYEYDINAKTGEIVKRNIEGDSSSSGSGNNGSNNNSSDSYISQQAALDAALSHAGVSASDIYDYSVEFERENSIYVYEIDFKSAGYEYNYEINAVNGQIIKYEREWDD